MHHSCAIILQLLSLVNPSPVPAPRPFQAVIRLSDDSGIVVTIAEFFSPLKRYELWPRSEG